MRGYSLIVILLAAIAFSACAKKKSVEEKKSTPPPVVNPDQNTDNSEAEQGPFVLNKNYIGKNLIMVYPHNRNWGVISLQGKDAQALYNVLQVKTVIDEDDNSFLPAKIRKGKNITCFEKSIDQTADVKSYACNMYIDYRWGLSQLQTFSPVFPNDEGEGGIDLQQNYSGEKLALTKEDGIGRLLIRGQDARALYFTLSPQLMVGTEGNRTRIFAGDLSCSEILLPVGNKKAYECLIRLNYRTGEALLQKKSN